MGADANFKRQRRALYQPGAQPQENKPRRRRFRSAEGPSEGEAEATELPFFPPPRPPWKSTKSCQAPKPPKYNKTKRKIAAHYIHSTLYNRNRDQNPQQSGCPIRDDGRIVGMGGVRCWGVTARTTATHSFQRFSTQNRWNQYFAAKIRRKPNIPLETTQNRREGHPLLAFFTIHHSLFTSLRR